MAFVVDDLSGGMTTKALATPRVSVSIDAYNGPRQTNEWSYGRVILQSLWTYSPSSLYIPTPGHTPS